MKKAIISIGAYSAEEVENLKTPNTIFYCFDPRDEVANSFVFKDNNIKFWQKAISHSNAKRFFKLEGTKSRLFENKGLQKDNTIIEVDVWSLEEAVELVLSEQGWRHGLTIEMELIMNCEGEEIPIILSTYIGILKFFKRIKIEFHPQYYFNGKDNIDAVLNKLKPYFQWTSFLASKSKSPIYVFDRK